MFDRIARGIEDGFWLIGDTVESLLTFLCTALWLAADWLIDGLERFWAGVNGR